MKEAYTYFDIIISQPRTPGGLLYDKSLSLWASNRDITNAASICTVFASHLLVESDSKRKDYIDFLKSQINYILGDNPLGVEDNSPKSFHQRFCFI